MLPEFVKHIFTDRGFLVSYLFACPDAHP